MSASGWLIEGVATGNRACVERAERIIAEAEREYVRSWAARGTSAEAALAAEEAGLRVLQLGVHA